MSSAIIHIAGRCRIRPGLPKEERTVPLGEKLELLRAGILPFLIFFSMTGLLFLG